MRIKHKLHYILKYLVLALPFLIIVLMPFVKDVNLFTQIKEFVLNDLNPFNGFPCQWYIDLLDIIGIDYSSYDIIGLTLIYYPVYAFYVYLFDLILDIICFLPKFLHDLFYDLMDRGKF